MSAGASESRFFNYGKEQIVWLSGRAQKLGDYIAKKGVIQREIHPDAFAGIAHAIIGQQISSKAQRSIWKRVTERFAPFGPGRLARAKPEDVRACGISGRKSAYLIGIAKEFIDGRLSHAMLAGMDDSELEQTLIALPGIGKWTAEMLLIFTFQRPNVLSFGDLAIQRGMRNLYGYEKVSRERFDYHFSVYSPWSTIASLYLWDIASNPARGA